MNQLRAVLAALLVIGLLITAGCGTGQENSQSEQQNNQITANGLADTKSKSSASGQQLKKVKLIIYFPNENGEKLLAADRTVNLAGTDKYSAAVNELLQGPKKGEGTNVIPKNTQLLNTGIDNAGIVTVNFNNAFVKNFTGGSTGELMLIGSIVDTLTNFQEVKAVRFYVEGKPLDALSGHMDLTAPVTRIKNIL
ncbi:GerMN domain-containing protein [Pectinatus frisingensis]|uniref:GerMN domain-containing protein n=1 Tax=Pectinatus frisingensis TaxID=865 RepID=UPI0015F5D2F0|nr:GerMN domain-containing protein [Pectinatus frisingensis]